MNRTEKMKAIVTGVCLVFGFCLTLLVFRAVWALGLLMLPFLLVAGAIYLVGYGAPNLGSFGREVHISAECKARQFLDWADFNAPHWAWPVVFATRTFLDWLGLQVAKTR